jgi:hypothetical protein
MLPSYAGACLDWALPLTIVFGLVAAGLLCSDLGYREAGLIATILAPPMPPSARP